ncbi:methionine synthase [Fusobacterium ulcerans]|uniref:Methionine synthase n=1 Tax=Fusobacterium ulcerans TaxID=861 RepID=A0AAX2JC05_9FUSO|nr:methionine synthase [Fusobacterium ulcerans]AVQ26737.1 methionine synthase [Fusobacterium ulcerans]EFS25145.1 methionine synthase [Fusobacterium ulcerans ATCC 49185]SQJ06867.1 Methionine synthase [Fusobacterium ulcerans]
MINELKKRVLVLDGATGTAIQKYNLTDEDFQGKKGCNEILNITRPDVIKEIHTKYIEAGADIIETNSFNCNRISLKDYEIEDMSYTLSKKGAELARETADNFYKTSGKKIYVAGSIGPTSKSLSLPMGDVPYEREINFDQMKKIYSEQIEGVIDGGVDCLLIETIFDGLSAKAALVAAEELFEKKNIQLPIMISATVNRQGKIFSGQSIESLITALDRPSIISFGLNCSFGARDLIPMIKRIASFTDKYISLYPNAGLPNEEGEYEETPEITAGYLKELVDEKKVNILGGCCGTHFSHIKAIADLVKDKEPRLPVSKENRYFLSGNEIYDFSNKFTIVGERNNVAGSKIFKTLIEEKNYIKALEIARSQIEKGAAVLDINLDDGLLIPHEEMERFLRIIQNDPIVSKISIMIDSSDFFTIETALKNIAGKSIVNSISLKEGEEAFRKKARIIKKYGAAMVVMAFDENGQGVSYERKVEICNRSYKILAEEGVPSSDIAFDPNILTIGTGSEDDRYNGLNFIKTVQWIKENLPQCSITGGLSNLSFAFRGNNPLRAAIHSLFIENAKEKGMNFAIMNPGEKAPQLTSEEKNTILSLINGEEDSLDSILELAVKLKNASDLLKKNSSSAPKIIKNDFDSLKDRIENALIYGGSTTFDTDINTAMETMTPLDIIQNILMKGMDKIGVLFEKGELYLPQLIRSASVMNRAVDILKPHMKIEANIGIKGKVLMATVDGDVHDIGKNIAGTVLKCNGYEVIDLGVMVSKEKILEEAVKNNVDIITLSGLISPSLKEMKKILSLLDISKLSIPVLIAGAATSKLHTAVKLEPFYQGKTFHTTDALDTLTIINKLIYGDRDLFITEKTKELRELCKVYLNNKKDTSKISVSPKEDFTSEVIAPKQLGKQYIEFPLQKIEKYINWNFLLHNMKVKNTPLEENTLNDAKYILEKMKENDIKVKCAFGIFPCTKDSDNLTIKDSDKNWSISFIRGEVKNNDIGISDFFNENDFIGTFIISVNSSLFDEDNYMSIMESILLTRIAEAASEFMENYLKEENIWLPNIRPAIGYSSIPDHSIKKTIFEITEGERTGAYLTNNFAMSPLSTVCGIYISNPKSFYFDLK